MNIIESMDDALLGVASRSNGVIRDFVGCDQWTSARTLMHMFMALCFTSQVAFAVEKGFDWVSLMMFGIWLWHYLVTMSGIEQYSRSSNGSSIARVTERRHRCLYVPLFAGVAMIILLAPPRLSGFLELAGFAAMISAHYLKAAEMPPPTMRRSQQLAPSF